MVSSSEEKEVYQRIICFKFIPTARPEAIQAHMAHFARLADQISQITSYSGGLTVADEHGYPPNFDSLHIATYHTMADIEAYFYHPAHQNFIETHKEIWADVLVLNSQID